ncbi:1-deoxy-D-xylulose-5-phosphate synthase [Bacteroidales bacterium OttesenSCG-928-I21]|nr:1-deoxy-D-xylulose-5-phosphate synthase [Bacteroidales bacterium OttesenSCG-928-I21]
MPENQESLLKKINSPDDLKKLNVNQLEQLSKELRQFIIDELCCNPGHFASSLGVIELTVALHYVYNTPYDRIVWDVGHQAYGHKILTGRRDNFHTNRKFKGVAPFPTPSESEYDSFISGHASTSISAALGMAVADNLKNEKRKIVAVIGDGSLTGGLAFEGLNNMSSYPNDTLIILNDNEMAIDPVVGGLSDYLVHITTSRLYNKVRYKGYRALKKLRMIKENEKSRIIMFNNSMKSLLSREHNIFEGLNIRYFGPVDGHDVKQLVRILRTIKDFKGPKVLHIKTIKGKGFEPAEKEATLWHAPGIFDKKTGIRTDTIKNIQTPPLFQDVFGYTLLELAEKNDKIVGITPAMPTGCSMNIMSEKLPHRVFDVGIAEGHSVTFSAGMAKEGLMPFCNIYSSFSQRAYDNIIHDVATQKLNMVICLDRAGLVGPDGKTHHGAFDMAFLRPIPELTIASPLNETELRNLMYTAQLPDKGPFVIRYPRGKGVLMDWIKPLEEIEIGTGVCLKEGNDIAVLTIGPIGNVAAKAIKEAEKENESLSAAHYDIRFLKPLDEKMLHEIGKKFKKIITIEDGAVTGGLGTAVLEFLSENSYCVNIKRLGIPDDFIEHGSVEELHQMLGLDADSIKEELSPSNLPKRET